MPKLYATLLLTPAVGMPMTTPVCRTPAPGAPAGGVKVQRSPRFPRATEILLGGNRSRGRALPPYPYHMDYDGATSVPVTTLSSTSEIDAGICIVLRFPSKSASSEPEPLARVAPPTVTSVAEEVARVIRLPTCPGTPEMTVTVAPTILRARHSGFRTVLEPNVTPDCAGVTLIASNRFCAVAVAFAPILTSEAVVPTAARSVYATPARVMVSAAVPALFSRIVEEAKADKAIGVVSSRLRRGQVVDAEVRLLVVNLPAPLREDHALLRITRLGERFRQVRTEEYEGHKLRVDAEGIATALEPVGHDRQDSEVRHVDVRGPDDRRLFHRTLVEGLGRHAGEARRNHLVRRPDHQHLGLATLRIRHLHAGLQHALQEGGLRAVRTGRRGHVGVHGSVRVGGGGAVAVSSRQRVGLDPREQRAGRTSDGRRACHRGLVRQNDEFDVALQLSGLFGQLVRHF